MIRPQPRRVVLALAAFLMTVLGVSLALSRAQAPVPATEAAATAPATQAVEGQQDVHIGVYINQIKSIDLKSNTFVVDFWIWFRWKGDIKPMDNFEVVGGHIDSKDNVSTEEVKGFHYGNCRVVATVTKFFDIARFPLDAHTLELNIEDGELEEGRLLYVADRENSAMSKEVEVPGWQINNTNARVHKGEYETNYGNIALDTGNKSVYSRFTYSIDLVRPGMGYFFKLFWSLFLATIIALLALLIDPVDLDPRFGLGVGAIFAAIASAYVISSALPESNQYTLADKMNMLAVGVIFISIFESVISLRLWKAGREAASRALDGICFWGFLVAYGLISALLVVL